MIAAVNNIAALWSAYVDIRCDSVRCRTYDTKTTIGIDNSIQSMFFTHID